MKAPNNKRLDDRKQNQLIVDFPAVRRKIQADRHVHFASLATVQPITSLLTVCSKQELWYSKRELYMIRIEITGIDINRSGRSGKA